VHRIEFLKARTAVNALQSVFGSKDVVVAEGLPLFVGWSLGIELGPHFEGQALDGNPLQDCVLIRSYDKITKSCKSFKREGRLRVSYDSQQSPSTQVLRVA